ncbi:MAG TPA: hypothetical protein PKN80_08435, partial [bacterium]|nr:hypothetical protein [bacterium]
IAALPSARPELPAGLDWLILKPTVGNQSRTLYELSGRWRFQPSAAERNGNELVNPGLFGPEWAYANTPGNWQASGMVFDQAGKPLAAWQGKALKDFPAAWYERDFNLPARYRSGRVLLHFPRVLGMAAVYLNGRLVGRVETTAPRTFELNSFLAWDRPNRLTVYNGLPFPAGMRVNGFAEAPSLEVRDTQEFDLSQPLINPSFRRSALDLLLPVENLSGKPLTLSARLRILDYREDKEVFLSEPREIRLAKGFNGDQAVSFPVSGLKTWSPETPNLYRCVVEISQAGKVVDLAYPEAFGYREVWVSGSDIFLNGKHLSIRGKSHNYLNGYGFNAQELALLKETGQNADRTNSPQPEFEKSLTVTDEFGWLVFYNGGGDRAAIRKILGRIGNHPSFIGWQYWSNGYINGPHGHPMQIGGRVDESIQKSDPDYRVMRELSQWDPYRLNAYYRLGTGGQFRSIMHYIGFGTPVQNMAEWTRWWAKEQPEPLVPMELTALQITQETPLWQKGSKEVILAEQAARYFGERPYRQVDEPLAATFAKPDFGINQWLLSPIRYDVKSMILERTLRAWRTYGINGYLLHMDGKVDQCYTAGKLNRQGEALKRNNAPVLFYLAGPESDFVTREHHFFSGRPVRKSAVVINDRLETLPGRVDWQVADASGRKLAGGGQAVTVENGGRLFVPVEFTAPAVQARQELVITATLQDGAGQVLYEDSLPVQVFPEAAFTWDRNVKVMLIDSRGDTSRLLEEMGVPYQVLNKDVIDRGLSSFKGYSLLIIGRDSYPEAAEIFKTWMPASGAVEE